MALQCAVTGDMLIEQKELGPSCFQRGYYHKNGSRCDHQVNQAFEGIDRSKAEWD